MFAYFVEPPTTDRTSNTNYLWIEDVREVTYETATENLAVLRYDYRFVVYLGVVYRVCEVELDDDRRFIKYWVDDPFKDFPDYEPIVAIWSGYAR